MCYDTQGDASIVIDAKMPLILAMDAFGDQAHPDSPPSSSSSSWRGNQTKLRKIRFNTRNQAYFETVKQALKPFGWDVIDFNYNHHVKPCSDGGVSGVTETPRESKQRELEKSLPVLVYQETTEDTVHTIRGLLRTGLVAPEACCALMDRELGARQLEELQKEMGLDKPVATVCSARIYDTLFQQVRLALRQGRSVQEIQHCLDQRVTEELARD